MHSRLLDFAASYENKEVFPRMISIITATYNVEQTISSCLDSLRQKAVPFEYLINDGLSSDSTLEILKKQSPESLIISEKDNGLYDALNKGGRLRRKRLSGFCMQMITTLRCVS